jgi:hypothetical protein
MDPDLTTQMHRLVWIHAGRKTIMLVFVMARLIYLIYERNIHLNNLQIQAHCHAFVVKLFASVVNRPDIDPAVARVLVTLCKLYAVYGINQRLGEFMQVYSCIHI